MFTWICPTCGREVPPSYDQCPDCAARAKAGAPPAEAAGQSPPTAATIQPPQASYTPPAVAPPPAMPHAAPAPRAGLPTWLLAIVFALAFAGLGFGVFWLVNHLRSGDQAAASTPSAIVPVRTPAKPHPLQRYVEVTGIRFVQTPRKDTEARFVVVNHSGADISDLAAVVNIWARTDKSEEEAAGNFTFKLPSLGPYESKEQTAPVNTKLKAYELPDWQNVSTEVQITSP